MTSHSKERISVAAAIAMGLCMSAGYPLGMIVAAGMPLAVLLPGTRKSAFKSAVGYYLAALWPMIPGLERYIGRTITVTPLALWILAAVLLSLPWTVGATTNRSQYLWRAPLALLATVIPPLGIVGLASPLISAGYLFPGTAWLGLVLVALLPGIVLAVEALPPLQRSVVRCLVVGFCIGSAVGGWHFHSGDTPAPRGWAAVNTRLADVSQPFQDFRAAQFIQQKAAESSARVLIFPEAVIPRWSEATEAFWRDSLDRWHTRGQIVALGAGLPMKITQYRQGSLAELRLYDFGAAIQTLKTMHGVPVHAFESKSNPEPTDNALLVMGAESATFYQRIPVPVGMWKPLSRMSVPLRLSGPGVVTIDHRRAAVLVCYEQMLTFPILTSMLQHPTVIIGISNTFWVDRTSIPRSQANAVRAWARLFHLPYLLAANS